MFHVHFKHPKEKVESILIEIYNETGIGLTNHLREISEEECYYEVSIGDRYGEIPKGLLEKTFKWVDEKLRKLNN